MQKHVAASWSEQAVLPPQLVLPLSEVVSKQVVGEGHSPRLIARAISQSCGLCQFFCACLSLLITHVGAGLTLVVLMIARHPSAPTISTLGKNKGLLLTRPGNYTAHLGSFNKVRGRKKGNAQAWGSVLLGSRVGA